MQIDFIVKEMTSLRYFIPIVEEAFSMGIGINFFCQKNLKKYNSINNNIFEFNQLVRLYNISIFKIDKIKNRNNPVFIIEDVGIELLESRKNEQKVYSITYSGDFIHLYKNYSDKVDNIFMISKFFSNFYECKNKRNLYFGSPKFDVKLNKEKIYKKYNLNISDSYLLIIYPRMRDLDKINLDPIYSEISKLGFKILVKTRGKDPVKNKLHRGDHYFIDESWFPHTTMELIEISHIVMNFGSAAIEECVMMNKPIIDFNIKPFDKIFTPLYDYSYCKCFQGNYDINDCLYSFNDLINRDHEIAFRASQEKHLYINLQDSASKIINHVT